MARIAGVNIPTGKRVEIALRYIHGIGPNFSKQICEKCNIPAERRVSQLTDAEVLQIRETIDRDYTVEGDLRREVQTNIKRSDGPRLLPRSASSQGPCPSAASARTRTLAPARARPLRSPVRRRRRSSTAHDQFMRAVIARAIRISPPHCGGQEHRR